MWFLIRRVCAFISLLITWVAVYMCTKSVSLFLLHPCMMSFAFVFGMAEGIQFLYTPSIISRFHSRKRKILFHMVTQTIAVIAVGIGFTSIYMVKISNGKEHFTTWHGILGAATCFFVGFSSLLGVVSFNKMKLASIIKPYRLKSIHKYVGVLTLMSGLISIGFGFSSAWAASELSVLQRFAATLFLFPVGISILPLIFNA